jgi:HSP20 family protein
MANLSVRRGEPRQALAGTMDPFRAMESLRTMDPFRMMRELMGVDPFAGMVAPAGAMFAPDIEIKETKDAFVLCADLPGVREQDVEISITGNRMTVSGKREEEERREDDRYFAYERSYGSFSRSFALPESADLERVHADLKDGVLHIDVPKRAEMTARKVEIGRGEKAAGKETEKTTGKEAEKRAPEAHSKKAA